MNFSILGGLGGWGFPKHLAFKDSGAPRHLGAGGGRVILMMIGQGLRLEPPYTGVSTPPSPEIPKKSQKGVPGPPGPECQKSVEKIPNDPKRVKKTTKSVFGDFFDTSLRAKGALISEPRFSTPCEMRFFPREKGKTAFVKRNHLDKGRFPFLAWEKSHLAGGRKSGLTN